jgi:hypothetical protein
MLPLLSILLLIKNVRLGKEEIALASWSMKYGV